MTSQMLRDCLAHAEFCEKLADQSGLEPERARLRRIAAKWRWLAHAFAEVLAGGDPTQSESLGPAVTPRPQPPPDEGGDP